MQFFQLNTGRLILRQFSPTDLPLMRRLDTDPEVVMFLGHGKVKTLDESEKNLGKIQDDYRRYGLGLFAAFDKDTDQFMGRCGLIPWTLNGILTWEIGYSFLRSAWGRGFATEAATQLARWAQENLEVPYVVSLIHPLNTASIHVAEKIGMTRWKEITVSGLDLVAYQKRFE